MSGLHPHLPACDCGRPPMAAPYAGADVYGNDKREGVAR